MASLGFFIYRYFSLVEKRKHLKCRFRLNADRADSLRAGPHRHKTCQRSCRCRPGSTDCSDFRLRDLRLSGVASFDNPLTFSAVCERAVSRCGVEPASRVVSHTTIRKKPLCLRPTDLYLSPKQLAAAAIHALRPNSKLAAGVSEPKTLAASSWAMP